MIMKRETHYKSERWLNSSDSPSTGSIVCYDGDVEYTEGVAPCVFVEFADCSGKIRLHQSHTDTTNEFIGKIDLMIIELTKFRNHLEFESPHNPEKL